LVNSGMQTACAGGWQQCFSVGRKSTKIVPYHGGSGPPSNMWLLRSTPPHMANGISNGPAVLPQYIRVTNRHTDGQTMNITKYRSKIPTFGWQTGPKIGHIIKCSSFFLLWLVLYIVKMRLLIAKTIFNVFMVLKLSYQLLSFYAK